MIFEIRPAWRQGLRISRAILALALTGSCLGCYPPGPRELQDDDKPVVVSSNPPAVAGMSWPDHPDYPRLVFGFELQTDRMSRDLTMLLVHRSKRYTDAEIYGAAMEKIAQVEQRVRDQSEWAALILRRELEEFGPEDAAAASDLIGLLGLVLVGRRRR